MRSKGCLESEWKTTVMNANSQNSGVEWGIEKG